MFKPLLRTLPSLSGNVKIVCFLNKFIENDADNYEVYVNSGQIAPLSSQLYSRYMNISFANSSYEWDIYKFYQPYANYMYEKLFEYLKTDLPIYNKYSNNKIRNTDFEFGVKRISYEKSFGKQFAFFAPIWIESVNDLPDYFEIHIDLKNSMYSREKTVKVHLTDNMISENHLGRYMTEYASKIDDKIIYCSPYDEQAVYYGINLNKGGFSKAYDKKFKKLLNEQNSIVNFDNIICQGFKRHQLAIKQILPLAFYFNVNDILQDIELDNFYGSEMYITGSYYKNGKQIPFFDFSTNYTFLQPKILTMNEESGESVYSYPFPLTNIMNMGYPSMREALFYKYRFTNKMTPSIARWKLKYSSDEDPYIINNSPAFSLYQDSKLCYGNYPKIFPNITAILSNNSNWMNVIFPLDVGRDVYPMNIIDAYNKIRKEHSSDWFEYYDDFNDLLSKCVDVSDDNKVLFRGILFDLNKIYDSSLNKIDKIKKFGVFLNPYFHAITDDDILYNLSFANYTILKNGGKYVSTPNCAFNDNLFENTSNGLFDSNKDKEDEMLCNQIFVMDDEDKGDFINLRDYGIDYNEVNKYYRINDLKNVLYYDFYEDLYLTSEVGYDVIPVNRADNFQVTSYDGIFYSTGSGAKVFMTELFEEDKENSLYKYTFYREGKFISENDLRNKLDRMLLSYYNRKYLGTYSEATKKSLAEKEVNSIMSNINNYFTAYQYHPVLGKPNGEVYAKDAFTSNDWASTSFYGQEIPLNKINEDIDVIYVDTYNYNQIAKIYNTNYLINSEKLAYLGTSNGSTGSGNISTYQPTIVVDLYNSHYLKYDIQYVEKSKSYAPYYYFGDFININETARVYDKDHLFTTKEGCSNWINSDEQKKLVTVNGSGSSIVVQTHIYNMLKNLSLFTNTTWMRQPALSDNTTWEKVLADIYSMHNYYNRFMGGDKYINMKDNFSAINTNVILLNYTHLKYYLNGLFRTWENSTEALSDKNCKDTLLSICVRRRILTEDKMIKDIYIPLNEILNMDNITKRSDYLQLISDCLRFDSTSNLFYFNCIQLRKISGELKYVSVNDLGEKIFDISLIGDYNNYKDRDGQFDCTQFKFELVVYNRQMLKVQNDVWRLLNLDGSLHSPYKDMYIYSFEKDSQFNNSMEIYQQDIPENVFVSKRRENLKPLFNIVEVEEKNESKIYTQYSLHNITRTLCNNPNAVNNPTFFYRYDSNNTNLMYDLSSLEKNQPLKILGTYYFYKDAKIDKDFAWDYAYFHNTYNLFKFNETKIVNHSYYSIEQVIDTATPVIEETTMTNMSYYSASAFKQNYPAIYEQLVERTDWISNVNGTYWKYIDEGTFKTIYGYLNTFTTTHVSHYTYTYKDVVTYSYTDNLGLYDKHKLNTYSYNGDIYGFYIIDVNFNNTNNSFDFMSYKGDLAKYFTHLNGISLTANPKYPQSIYRQCMPFIKSNPLRDLVNSTDLMVKPNIFRYPIEFIPKRVEKNNKLTYYDVVRDENSQTMISLERYFDNITPLITEKNTVGTYMMKYKNSYTQFNPTYFTNETIYFDNVSINQYPGVKVYDIDKNTYTTKYDYEYKNFNDNKYFNLKEEMIYEWPEKITREQILSLQTDDKIFEVFKKLMTANGLSRFDDDSLRYALSKYRITYGIVGSGLNSSLDEKLYIFSLKFSLY